MYKIVCKNPEIKDVYVGHTTNFRSRKNQHKTVCNNEKSKSYNFKIYKSIRDNEGWENYSMIQIELYECETKLEARARENYWCETLNANLNTHIPNQTRKEYYEKNKEKDNLTSKEYRLNNLETVTKYYKEYYQENKISILQEKKEYYLKNKDTINEKKYAYHNENRATINQHRKELYELNKDAINEKRRINKAKIKIISNDIQG